MRDSGYPKSRFAVSLRKIGSSLLKLFGGDFPVFLLFLGITFFLWWSQTMSQNYDTVMKVHVQVTGMSDDMRVTVPPANQISVSLSGKGSALRKSGRMWSRRILNISNTAFNLMQGHASLSTFRLIDSVSAFLPASVSIRSIAPDSLVYQYAMQHSIMLPVEFGGTFESQDQFFMERMEFQPDSICAQVLLSDTLSYRAVADAGPILLSSDTTVQTVSIKPVPGVIFSTEEVQMTVIARQYTEKSLEIPITGVNFPDHLSLKSFPSKAVVIVWVKMSEYDKVSESDFQVVVDYNDLVGGDASKAPLRIFSQPVNVRNVRLQTRTVDYLMERKLF